MNVIILQKPKFSVKKPPFSTMTAVIADLREQIQGQLAAKKNALIATEETIKKFVGERSFTDNRSPGRDGGNFGRGRGNFTPRGMGRGSRLSMADRFVDVVVRWIRLF